MRHGFVSLLSFRAIECSGAQSAYIAWLVSVSVLAGGRQEEGGGGW